MVGLIRLAIRLLRREDISSQVHHTHTYTHTQIHTQTPQAEIIMSGQLKSKQLMGFGQKPSDLLLSLNSTLTFLSECPLKLVYIKSWVFRLRMH